jgi:uncharacterized membrane protein
MNFLKTTLIGGMFFLIPLVVLGIVIAKAIGFMLVVAEPMAKILPIDSVGGIALANLIALAIVLLICFLAGLLALTAPAQKLANKAEAMILQRIPGYTFFKGMTSALSPDENVDLHSVLVTFDDRARIGLEVEKIGTDRAAVYFPGSPNAWSGIVEIISIDQITYMNKPMMSVIEHAEQLGRGTSGLLPGQKI